MCFPTVGSRARARARVVTHASVRPRVITASCLVSHHAACGWLLSTAPLRA